MLRRLLPTLVALGCGLLALGWGLVSLQRIFLQEREDARAQVHSRREALQHFATQTLRLSLPLHFEARLPSLHDAAGDPLVPADGFYLHFRGKQLLPRPTRARRGTQTPFRDAYYALEAYLREGTASALQLEQRLVAPLPNEPDEDLWKQTLAAPLLNPTDDEGRRQPLPAPRVDHAAEIRWEKRLVLLKAAEAALSATGGRSATRRVEAMLRFHADNPLPAQQELLFLLLAAEQLQRGADTEPLVRGLLREGLPEEFGGFARSAGLQRDLLRARPRLTQVDFDFLHNRIVQLSASLGEPFRDFVERATEVSAGGLVIPEDLGEPVLMGEQWFLTSRKEAVYGIAVNMEDLLRPIAEDLRARQLLDADGVLRLKPGSGLQPVRTVQVLADMPQWARAEADIEARYGLKTALVAVCGALALAIFALSVVSQQRKYRFLELKSDFVATVSHELRTPLASIRLLGETLERKLAQTPEVRDYPTRIVQAADGLHFLVENILSFNRIDKGRWKLRTSQVRLDDLVHLLRTDLANATNAPVELTADVGDVELEADPSLLRLLFSNLGRNACAYNRRSPVVIHINAQQVPGHFCTVLFQDNGVGIAEYEWENVFQEFYRLTHAGPEVHGSGLGLALCRKIMKLHGGDIQVVSSGPEGTTFALNFHESHR
jgi:signal transduction histidine kinase